MPDPPRQLDQVQRWFQAVITHPLGVEHGVDSDAARQSIDFTAENVEHLIGRSKSLTSLQRLAVYGNAYYSRLLECMGEVFPVLRTALGDDAFNQFAFGYLQRYPSHSYTLGKLGSHFAQYLKETRPDREQNSEDEKPGGASRSKQLAHDESDADWPDLLIDLARLEWTIDEVFDGPGVEGKPLLSSEDIARLPADRWPDARLIPVVCLRLLAFRFPVNDFYTQTRRDEQPDVPPPSDTFLAVTRREFIVRRYPLLRPQYELLGGLQSGQPVGAAIARAAACSELDDDALAAQLNRWFHEWARESFFQAVEWA